MGRLCTFSLIICAMGTLFAKAETLDEALAVAVRVNYRLQSETHQVRAAQAELQVAKANRLPTVSNRTSYFTLSSPPSASVEIPTPTPLGTLNFDLPICDPSFATSLTTATLPLYTGGKINAAIQANRFQIRAAQAGYAVSFQAIRWQTTESYFNILRARRLREAAQSTEKSVIRHLADVEKLLAQKMITRNALLAAQSAKANATQNVLKAENAVVLAEAAYNRLTGRQLDTMVLIEEIPIPALSGDLTALTEEALRNRKELRQIQAKSQASSALSQVEAADRLPQIAAVGGYSYMENSRTNREDFWVGGVSLKWTPLDGGAAQSKARAAKENAAAAAKQREEVRSLIELQVRAAWLTERETRERIEVAELGLKQAAENLRIVTRQFQEGLVNHTEVLDAQTLRTVSDMNHCNAIYDAILATYNVQYAVGIF